MLRGKGRVRLWIFFLLLSFAAGCWDRRELDEVAIVMGAGIDQNDKLYQFSCQIVKPGELKSAGSSAPTGGGTEPVFIVKSSGQTVFDAVENATTESSRHLFFPHNQVIVIGRDLASRGVQPALDFFLRDPEPRPTEWVLIAGESAEKILEPKSELEKTPATALGMLVENGYANGKINPANLKDFSSATASKTASALAPMVMIKGKGEEARLLLSGTAVFKRDKMVGVLNGREARGVMWVLGKVKGGSVVLNLPKIKGKVGIEIVKDDSRITARIINGVPKIRVSIQVEGVLRDQTSPEDLTSSSLQDLLIRDCELVIKNEVLAAIRRGKVLHADIFDFGTAFFQNYPREWKRMESQWDDIFPRLDIEVSVDASLRRLGRLTRPAVPKE